jgi:hypothetical protein
VNATTSTQPSETRRDWDFQRDGALDGLYVELRQVMVKSGPSAGKRKVVLDLHVGLEDELVSVFPSTVALRKLREELARRGTTDFEPDERLKIARPGAKKQGPNGGYWDDDVWFEHAAPKPTAAEMLGASDEPASSDERPEFSGDDDIAFS